MGDRERRVCGRDAAVDRRLEQDLLDLFRRQPVTQRRPDVQLQLVINNLLNDRSIYWTTSTNGAATSALRARGGDYSSPARETVPVGFGLKQPINFNLSAAWRM